MVQFLTGLVWSRKGILSRAETILCHGLCLAPGQLYQHPCVSAAPSAVGAVKEMGDPVGKLFPVSHHQLSPGITFLSRGRWD